jgi:hypothetical protein
MQFGQQDHGRQGTDPRDVFSKEIHEAYSGVRARARMAPCSSEVFS